jgi:hypothetical protein
VHTRRISTFLLGAWIGGVLFMGFITIQNVRVPRLVLAGTNPTVAQVIKKLGYDDTALLLRHAGAEETRRYSYVWEEFELFLGVMLGGCLFLGTQRRALPLALCGVMLALVLFQHVGVTPELAYRGRETDFPPGNNALGPMTRMLAMQQVYFGIEIVKLATGVILSSYLFVFRAQRRGRKPVHALDHPHPSPVDS